MKYKVGDKVVLSDREGIREEFKGKEAEIIALGGGGGGMAGWIGKDYTMKVEGRLHLAYGSDGDIDHKKTAELNKKNVYYLPYEPEDAEEGDFLYLNTDDGVIVKRYRDDNWYEIRNNRILDIEPTTNIQRHKELTDLMHQTYIEKNKDYGDSFGQTHKKYGALAGLTRIADKFHRLENIILNDATIQVDDESVIDTLVDMSNYGLLLAMELEGKK